MPITRVKHLGSRQLTADEEVDITDWLSYEITQLGSVGCRIGDNKHITVAEDFICICSDGIPFATGTKLKITFDQGVDSGKRIQIDYTKLECCQTP